MFFFVPKQDSKVRRTIIKLEFKYQDTDQQVSLFDEKFFTAYADLPWILRFSRFLRLG